MKYALELQDELFSLFIMDAEICTLLNINDSTDIADCSTKIRRGIQPAKVVNDAPDLFLDYFVVPSYSIDTGNYLTNGTILEFDIYGKYKGQIAKLFRAVNRVLKENYEDMRIIAEGNMDSPVTGLYLYMFRTKPLVKA
jgi:hypothetical protein